MPVHNVYHDVADKLSKFRPDDDIYQLSVVNAANDLRKGPMGRTILHMAAVRGKANIIKALLEAGRRDVDVKDDDGKTALHLASERAFDNMVELLCRVGTNLSSQDKEGHTPLHEAVIHNHSTTVKLLLRYGANRNIKDDKKRIPEDYAYDAEMFAVFGKAAKEEHRINVVLDVLTESEAPEDMNWGDEGVKLPGDFDFLNFPWLNLRNGWEMLLDSGEQLDIPFEWEVMQKEARFSEYLRKLELEIWDNPEKPFLTAQEQNILARLWQSATNIIPDIEWRMESIKLIEQQGNPPDDLEWGIGYSGRGNTPVRVRFSYHRKEHWAPCLNVKVYDTPSHVDMEQLLEELNIAEEEMTCEAAWNYCWERTAEQFWEDVIEEAKVVFGKYVRVSQEGRSGGWLVVEGLPPLLRDDSEQEYSSRTDIYPEEPDDEELAEFEQRSFIEGGWTDDEVNNWMLFEIFVKGCLDGCCSIENWKDILEGWVECRQYR